MNNELLEALNILEQEKNISKETLLEAIENSLLTACKNHFGKADNVKVVLIRRLVNTIVFRKRPLWKKWRIQSSRSHLSMHR